MGRWLYLAFLALYVIFLAIQMASGGADGWIARLHRGPRQRRYAQASHARDPVQATLDEHAVPTHRALRQVAGGTRPTAMAKLSLTPFLEDYPYAHR